MTAECRFCQAELTNVFVDLGMSPLSNSYLSVDALNQEEAFFPLKTWVCDQCMLVQLEQFATPDDIFGDYAYFSSYSDAWLEHARRYAQQVIQRFALDETRQVVEIASNDGYLLKNFKQAGVPCLGIEPAANVAAVAEQQGIPTRVAFFGRQSASQLVEEGIRADLIAAKNVMAHVPDINDFVGGFRILLAPGGVITVEFPHLLELMHHNQFDTIYHEHFSYFSLYTVNRIFEAHDLKVFDVEELPTHGGSLRIYATHAGNDHHEVSEQFRGLLAKEVSAGLIDITTYSAFSMQVYGVKNALLEFLITTKRAGKSIAAYGAPAKGNTLLNFCGIRQDFIDYTVDRSPHKQDKFLPGTHIPVYAPEHILQTRPDYLLILPWNLKDEVIAQMQVIRDWGGQFVIPVPELTVIA